MHDCQPWVSVLLTNRVSAPPFSQISTVLVNCVNAHHLKRVRSKARQIKTKVKYMWLQLRYDRQRTKGNLQELCHNAYQELPFRFCVQNWRIKYKCLDVFISRLHERYLTHVISPTDYFEISLKCMFAISEDCTHSPCLWMLLILAPLCAHGRAVYTGRTHEACLVMLFNTHGLAPGSAPQVSH